MFEEKENPGYDKMRNEAAGLIAEWLRNDWYESSFDEAGRLTA